MDDNKQIDWLRKRLQLPLPGKAGQERMSVRLRVMPDVIPSDARQSGVLCLLFPKEDKLNVLLIQRMADKGAHSGQVAFPGGSYEAGDGNLQTTALREAYEEVGILADETEILGALTPLYIPVSNFMVHPFVAYTKHAPAYKLSKDEVDYIMELPLDILFHAGRKVETDVTSPVVPGIIRQVKAYKLKDGTIIWGATAMMLSELEAVMEEYTY